MAPERCITCYLPVADGKACPCGCGRLICSSCGTPTSPAEPTATQLYDAVKALRAANGHRVLTIPEINSVLVARAEFAAGVAAGPQATPQVLWEGETRMVMHTDPSLNGTTSYIPSPDAFDVPPGTRVRVVAAPTGQEPCDECSHPAHGAERCDVSCMTPDGERLCGCVAAPTGNPTEDDHASSGVARPHGHDT